MTSNNGITLTPTLYLERVAPAKIEGQTLKPLYPSQYDVVAKDMFGNVLAVWPWHYTSKPDKRNHHVMLNCYRHHVIWS